MQPTDSNATALECGWDAWRRGDIATAIIAWGPAADGGDPEAQFQLGLLLINSGEGLRNPARAVQLFSEAAENGHVEAQYSLGVVHQQGIEVAVDAAEAAYWYGRAAEAGHAPAQCNLAGLYESGTGVSQANTKTITLGGALVTSGAFAATFSLTGTTSVILPTAGTLATLAGTEELTSKTLAASVGKGTWTTSGTWILPGHTVNGLITSNMAGNWLLVNGATTGTSHARVVNTGGDLYWSIENSAGGSLHTGVGAYGSAIGSSGATEMNLITTNTSRLKVLSGGTIVFVLSASPASGAACTAGSITWDASYVYVCTASGAWKRTALTGGY